MINTNIFLLWTGLNKPSHARLRCIYSYLSRSGVNITLITHENLHDWVRSPIHPAYPFLSCTHRADYLRAYLMHNYGGGYSDIKHCNFDWRPHFDLLSSTESALMAGYPENSATDIASEQDLIRNSYANLPGMCHFIFKPTSTITTKWLSDVEQILTANFDDLANNPGTYHPRAIKQSYHGRNPILRLAYAHKKYPLSWNQLLGSILHPIMHTTSSKEKLLVMQRPVITNYR
jgi:hypothetical protein